MFRSSFNPALRFDHEVEWEVPPPSVHLTPVPDHSKSVLSENRSPDLGFRWSVNPYRGCQHACAYCYARPSHEYLGYGAGTDFDTRILVKERAPALLKAAFDRRSWKGELVMMSGNTDCYQPLEARYRITRGLLEVCRDYRNPVGIITRSALIARDIDVLTELAWVGVTVSIPFDNAEMARPIEPWAPPPSMRYRTIERLARAGIPVGVNVAPIIPGLTDDQIPTILARARDAGAQWASHILLRLHEQVLPVFVERVEAAFPGRSRVILAKLARMRGGELHPSSFQGRMRGRGPAWDAIESLFRVHRKRLGYREMPSPPSTSPFRRPGFGEQQPLFGGDSVGASIGAPHRH